MKAYKGFDKDLKCRGFQFEAGKEYREEKADICKSGFHACENPLDVFKYYPPATSRYCKVDLDANEQKEDDSKRVGKKILILDEISLQDMINAGIAYIEAGVNWEDSASTNTGDHSASTNTGDGTASTNTGDSSASTNTGYNSASTNTGYSSVSTNTGYSSASTNTGYNSASTNTGDRSVSTNTGYNSASTNTGYRSVSTNTGDHSASTNTGYRSVSTNTGDHSASTNTGDHSVSTNTGDHSAAVVEGEESVAAAIGYKSKAKGSLGSFLVLADWIETDGGRHIVDVKSVKVDGEKIKPGVFYTMKDGEIIEADASS